MDYFDAAYFDPAYFFTGGSPVVPVTAYGHRRYPQPTFRQPSDDEFWTFFT